MRKPSAKGRIIFSPGQHVLWGEGNKGTARVFVMQIADGEGLYDGLPPLPLTRIFLTRLVDYVSGRAGNGN